DSRGVWAGESAWDGSGGGPSIYEDTPTHAPDVAFNADPQTGFAIYDSVPFGGDVGWQEIGGTSAGAPQWAALIAVTDQGRAIHKLGSLDGPNQTLNGLYQIPRTDFHDITTGFNGYFATTGIDYA